MAEISPAEIEAYLREVGLIDPGYNGPVTVTATTSEGTDSITITV